MSRVSLGGRGTSSEEERGLVARVRMVGAGASWRIFIFRIDWRSDLWGDGSIVQRGTEAGRSFVGEAGSFTGEA